METCERCGYEINNPTCIGCLRKEVLRFVKTKPLMRRHVKEAISSLKQFNVEDSRCVNCKRRVNVCKYCFKSEINNVLVENNLTDLKENVFKLTPRSRSLY